MDAVIFAAGRGTRLRPLTNALPKPLVPVAGEGTLPRLLRDLPDHVDRVLMVVGYLEHLIRDAIGDVAEGRDVVYLTQSPLDGTGGALRQARELIRGSRFLAVAADDIRDKPGLEALCRAERAVQVHRRVVSSAWETWDVHDGHVVGLVVTPPGSPAFMGTGAYVLGQEWFETEPARTVGRPHESSVPHALPQLLDRFRYQAVETSIWYPCGTFKEIRAAELALGNATYPVAAVHTTATGGE
jgi:NDP-sugar pyrophosphorylase family protein